MTPFSTRMLPLAIALTFTTFALPVQASEDECRTPKSNYSEVQCTSDKAYFTAYDNDYNLKAILDKQGMNRPDFIGE